MKKIGLSIVALLCAVSLWAVPAYPGWQTKTQPDGTTIEVRLVGDEFYSFWETRDGKLAFEQKDGTFTVTSEPRPSGKQIMDRRKASKMYVSRPRKAIGERNLAPKGLVILVQFQDVSFKAANNAAAFDNMLNQEGYSYGGATGSAVDYFKAQSNGTYEPQFDVFGPVTLPNNLVYYGEQDNGKDGIYGTEDDGEHDLYIADFVIDAVKAANDAGCDFSQYDSDNDGFVDIVYFFYAGKGQAAGGTSETIWPHNWELRGALYYGQTHGTSGYYVNANQGYITSENLPTFDGKKINNYVCSAELKSSGSRSGIGTLCHEFSHVLGMPDYYDTEYGENDENGITPNKWSIMDLGSYNNDEMTPPNYSIFDKYFMGWATPKFLAKNAQLDVTMTTGYDDAYQITGGNSLVDFTNTGTVYYIENRQQSGWDAYLPGHGMIVWQVKYNATAWEYNEPNNTAGNPRYTLVPADGKTSNYGKASDAFPRSSVTSYTPYTGCALTNITETNNNITFKYNGGEVNYWTYEIDAEHCSVPANGQVDKGAALNLTITPDDGYTLADAECWGVQMGTEDLDYGTGFTYTEGTGAFTIANVTGNVYMYIVAKEVPATITWMSNGVLFTTTQTSAGKLVLPNTEPEACEGKVFYGWTATSNYTHETTAPSIVKDGDDATATTYYAVFATEETGGATTWNLVTNASSLQSGDVLVIASNSQGKTAGDISSQIMGVVSSTFSSGDSYATITSLGTGTVELTLGGSSGAWTLTSSDGKLGATAVKKLAWDDGTQTWSISISGGNATIQNGTSTYGRFLHNVSNPRFTTYGSGTETSATMLLPQLYRKTGGTSYSDFTTSCVPPTKYAITVNEAEHGSLETSPADEAAAGKTVTITITPDSHYHLATLTVKDAENGDVEISGTGNTRTFTMPEKAVTITGTFAEDDKYTVRFFNNGVEISEESYYAGETAVKPTDPENPCEEYTFVGWWTAELAADNTTSKTWVTDFTVSGAQDYYAIFSKTEEGSGSSITINASDFSSVGSGSPIGTKTVNGITFTGAKGSNKDNAPKYYSGTPNTIRCYAGNKLTISAENSISQIDFNYDGSYDGGSISRSTGSWKATPTEGWNQTWTGEANSIQFTINGSSQWRITAMKVSIGGGSTTYYSSIVNCGTTSIEDEIVPRQSSNRKFLKDGQLLIFRDGRMYTLMGNLVE